MSGTPLLAALDGKEKKVRHAEGIALDPERARAYVVTDDGKSSRLLTYRIE